MTGISNSAKSSALVFSDNAFPTKNELLKGNAMYCYSKI